MIYRGTRQGFRKLFRMTADGSGSEERLTTKAGALHTPTAVTPDGKWVVILESGAPGADIVKVSLEGAHILEPVVATSAAETDGQVSPDGRSASHGSSSKVAIARRSTPTLELRRRARRPVPARAAGAADPAGDAGGGGVERTQAIGIDPRTIAAKAAVSATRPLRSVHGGCVRDWNPRDLHEPAQVGPSLQQCRGHKIRAGIAQQRRALVRQRGRCPAPDQNLHVG